MREQCPNTDFHNGIWKTQVFFFGFFVGKLLMDLILNLKSQGGKSEGEMSST